MRAVLCTSGGVAGAAVLQTLLACPRIEVAGIVRSTRVLSARYGMLRGPWEQVRRSGMRYALYLACFLARRLQSGAIPVLATRDLNSAEGRAFIQGLAPDLLVSAFFNQRIGEAVRAIPKAGAVNIHPSLLPAFRGVDPVFYARLRGAAPLGVSVHRISAELDCGNILAQEACAAPPDESILRTTARLFERGAGLLTESLEAIAAGSAGTPQPRAGEYDSWPSREQVALLRRAGFSLVRWRDLRLRAA